MYIKTLFAASSTACISMGSQTSIDYHLIYKAEGRREPTQYSVLPAYLGWKGDDLHCNGRPVPPTMTYCTALPWQEAVQLRASGNPSYCCCCWCFTKCTQNTDITEIKQGRQGPALHAHECRNWDWGRAVPFLWIFLSNFRYCIFAVYWVQCI